MKPFYLPLIFGLSLLTLPGCFTLTRIESDKYTVTQRDTTIREDVNNAPGERDNGTIYPSPRTVDISRRYVTKDSTVNRYYPAFLRAGGIEAASFIAPGASTDGGGNGLFGLYRLLSLKSPDSTKIFGANMYRIAPYELRLRVFNDDPNWTIGTALYEIFTFQKDSSAELDAGEQLDAALPLYVRRRFFLRDKPPYIMVVPFFGIGLAPSTYVNLGATFDVGSYGGLNLRAYAGFIAGTKYIGDLKPRDDHSLNFPYFGIGVSALDFVNKTEELFIEWKDHDHSAIEVIGAHIDLVYSTTANSGSFLNQRARDSSTKFPSGIMLRLAGANLPLPIADGNLFVGTNLLNVMALSGDEIGFGWLPIRAGYRLPLFSSDINLTGFAEYIYYPSTIFHVGARASLKIYDWTQLTASMGYVSGSANLDVVTNFDELKGFGDFSTFYVGVGVGLGDVFHSLEEINRK